ncbi:hypothetical protein GGI35DRAFT_492929 [Trichoderma velutinum]
MESEEDWIDLVKEIEKFKAQYPDSLNNSNDQSFETVGGNENNPSLQNGMTATVQHPDILELPNQAVQGQPETDNEHNQWFSFFPNAPMGSNQQGQAPFYSQPTGLNPQPQQPFNEPEFNQALEFNQQTMTLHQQPTALNVQPMVPNQQLQWPVNQQAMGFVPLPPTNQQPLLNPELNTVYNNVDAFGAQLGHNVTSDSAFPPVSHTTYIPAYDPSLGLGPGTNSGTNSNTTSITTSNPTNTTSNTISNTISGTNLSNTSPLKRIRANVSNKVTKSKERFRCDECETNFTKKSALRTHLTSSKAHPLMHIQCRCSKTFDKYGLRQHLTKRLKECKNKTDCFLCHCGKIVSNSAAGAEDLIVDHGYACGSIRNRTADS